MPPTEPPARTGLHILELWAHQDTDPAHSHTHKEQVDELLLQLKSYKVVVSNGSKYRALKVLKT